MEHQTNSAPKRLGTSIQDDIDAFVPDAAEPLFEPDPGRQTPSILTTDETMYHTDVHCTQCYCDVAARDRATHEVSCPNCGWSSEEAN